MKNRYSLAVLAGFFLAMVPGSGWAQEESPPLDEFVVYNPETGEYTLNLDVLTAVGSVVTDAPDSWPVPSFLPSIEIGDLTFNPLQMTYNRYVTPEGYYVLVPSLYTAIVMSFTGTPPFDVEPYGGVVNGWVGAAGYMGWMESIGYTQEDVLSGDWQYQPQFWTQLFLAVNDPNSPLYEGTFFAPPAILIYLCDPRTRLTAPRLWRPNRTAALDLLRRRPSLVPRLPPCRQRFVPAVSSSHRRTR